MRIMLLALTAALVVAAGPASFAAQQNHGNAPQQAPQGGGSNLDNECSSILADPPGHSADEVAYCRSRSA